MRVLNLLSFTLLSALHSAVFATELLDRSESLHFRGNAHERRNAQVAQAQAEAQGQAVDTNSTTDDDDPNVVSLDSAATTGPVALLGTGSASPSGMPNAASKKLSSGRRLPHFTYDQLYNLQIKFLDSFIYPNNQKEAQKINSTVFSEDVQGRVDVTRTFDGRELNTEYIYGLFSNLAANTNPDAFSLLGYATSYEIIHFAASQNIASASTRFNFTFPFLRLSVPVIIDTWNVFNAQGQVSMYDAVFRYFDWLFSYLLSTAAASLHMSEVELATNVTKKLAGSICDTAMTYCNGTNTQYNSTQSCMAFLTQETRLGQPYELGRNTLLCRMVHQNMVPYRPSVHCPHIGPSGGGYCDDRPDYNGTVSQNYFSNYPFVYESRNSRTGFGNNGPFPLGGVGTAGADTS